MTKKELMSVEEEKRLEELEAIIQKDLKGFIRVGMALKEIKKARLYRGKYDDWKTYLKAEWDLSKTHANCQINAFNVIENLKHNGRHGGQNESDELDKNDRHGGAFDFMLPQNERQTRPLTLLPPVQQITAWEQILKRTDGKVTALEVSKVVEEFLEQKQQKETEIIKKKVSYSAGISDDFSEAFGVIIDVIDKHRAAGWKNLKRKKAMALVAAIMDHLK